MLSPRPMELTFAIDLKETLMFAFVYSRIQINTTSQENLKVPLSKDWVAFRGFTILESPSHNFKALKKTIKCNRLYCSRKDFKRTQVKMLSFQVMSIDIPPWSIAKILANIMKTMMKPEEHGKSVIHVICTFLCALTIAPFVMLAFPFQTTIATF